MNSLTSRYIVALPLLLLVVCILAFSEDEEQLTAIPHEEVLRKLVSKQNKQFLFAPYKNEDGQSLSKDESRLLNEGKLARTYFRDKNGDVKEVRCYAMTETRKIEEARLTCLLNSNPFNKINLVNINCSDDNMGMLYRKVIKLDTMQQSDLSPQIIGSSEEDIVVSTIEQCRFPFKSNTVETAWQIIFPSPIKGLREFYYTKFKEAYENGLLSCDNFNDLEDKIMQRRSFRDKSQWKFESRDAFFEFLEKKEEFPGLDVEEYFKKANSGPVEFTIETN